MRIIAGDARGRKLVAPAGENTRPTSDKLRGAVFNILAFRVPGARVLDLFAGTGALALEAISRGARSAVLVDVDQRAVEAIRKNAATVAGTEGDVRVVRADYRQAIAGLPAEAFDLVFLDPPYAMADAYGDALARLVARGLVAEGGIAVCERARDVAPVVAAGFAILDRRAYGDTYVDLLKREQ